MSLLLTRLLPTLNEAANATDTINAGHFLSAALSEAANATDSLNSFTLVMVNLVEAAAATDTVNSFRILIPHRGYNQGYIL